MDTLDRDERRFIALRETLRLYVTAARECDEAAFDERHGASDGKADSLARVAQAVLGMDQEPAELQAS